MSTGTVMALRSEKTVRSESFESLSPGWDPVVKKEFQNWYQYLEDQGAPMGESSTAYMINAIADEIQQSSSSICVEEVGQFVACIRDMCRQIIHTLNVLRGACDEST